MKLPSRQSLSEHRSSATTLILANLLPLVGVLFWGWSTFAIVLIYWSENVAIGCFNVLKMLLNNQQTSDGDGQGTINHAAKLFYVPFFTFHYGMFCLVHGVFVFVLLDSENPFGDIPTNATSFLELLGSLGLGWGILGLVASHGFSLVSNYLLGGEYQRIGLTDLMMQPYPRIVVLHIAIILGAFATIALGSPTVLLMILIAGKTILDLALHLREHSSYSNNQRYDSNYGKYRGNDGFNAGP